MLLQPKGSALIMVFTHLDMREQGCGTSLDPHFKEVDRQSEQF